MKNVAAFTFDVTLPAVGAGFLSAILFRPDGMQAGVTPMWIGGIGIAVGMILAGVVCWQRPR
ncbi:hypothetical protein SAMN05216360_10517 [Methylobacterium phyllostachyos]|uniref:Uncharacterized protein n=1 Tax=Methylobacterium phyllostachyos TaxID=582672 RepID=A0A1G9XSI3_9HYPH|nr:hypothetical protein [Methylobacterium phyllostachyos]SDM99779.1 hypothetical protein SAMN05216360_10517 [Methylobacterium phyllostachyos]